MDEVVEQAMARWPDVPHCHGWLALDARGGWRVRDEAAQAAQRLGERITHPALLDFIRRNYGSDGDGRWYFQNGPQRVFVDLEATPYVARLDPGQVLVLQTNALLRPERAWLTAEGEFLFEGQQRLALLDDRDLASCLAQLRMDQDGQAPVTEDALLLDWLEGAGESAEAVPLYLRLGQAVLPLQRLPYAVRDAQCAARFGFERRPRAAGTQ